VDGQGRSQSTWRGNEAYIRDRDMVAILRADPVTRNAGEQANSGPSSQSGDPAPLSGVQLATPARH
jgi:hypothetical protein